MIFTEKDLTVLDTKGISVEKANWQIDQFVKGVAPIKLYRPAVLENGVTLLDDIDNYQKIYDKAQAKIVKFVPASGAASRMFKTLFDFREKAKKNPDIDLTEYPEVEKFFTNIKKFAFYNLLDAQLERAGGITQAIRSKKYAEILDKLLDEGGLSYGSLPKGLLAFHFYAGGISRTPFAEHLVEGARYACSSKNKVYMHFTVSPEHLSEFQKLKDRILPKYQDMYSVNYEIEFSIQKASTDTIAVTPDNKPFYDLNSEILFRPGGHGALIENLNEIDADIIFIKNIDNVLPEKRISNTVKYKKALAGYLLEIQNSVFRLLKALTKFPSEETLNEAKQLLKNTFCLSGRCIDEESSIENIISLLNRPIRICGVVKNQGEPGGGPFLAIDTNDCVSPQIVESSQVDFGHLQQKKIFSSSTHFNPVDLICAVKNFKGEKFDLRDFIDQSACFISKKSKNGKDLKALELPGLWNGAMAFWNTVFVEVPVNTFNPVKTVNDLLREAHQ